MSEDRRTICISKKKCIYLEGDPASSWFEVDYGVVMTCRYLPSGRRQVTGFFTKGDVFGLDASHYTATAESVTDVVLRASAVRWLDRSDQSSITWPHSPLAIALQSAERRIQLLVRPGAAARLAGFVLTSAVQDASGSWIAHLPMQRADVADYLAMDVATVSRMLSRFVRQGLIGPRQGDCHRIRDIHRLKSLAGEELTPFETVRDPPQPSRARAERQRTFANSRAAA